MKLSFFYRISAIITLLFSIWFFNANTQGWKLMLGISIYGTLAAIYEQNEEI